MSKNQEHHILLISGATPDSKSVAAVMSVMKVSGAMPMLIANHSERVKGLDDDEIIAREVEQDMEKAHGVVIMGNDMDIDPGDYGETKKHPATNSEKDTHEGRVRAKYEYKLIEKALELGLPSLCICGGMQRLNVMLGGTLHQHVPDIVGSAYHNQGAMGIAPFVAVQYIRVLPNTLLASISKEVRGLFAPKQEDLMHGVFMDNSFHHQAVNKVGSGLMASAYSVEMQKPETSIIQAIEPDKNGHYKDQFLLGLQWHPEFGASEVSIRSLQQFNAKTREHALMSDKNIAPEAALAITAKSIFGDKLDWNTRNGLGDWKNISSTGKAGDKAKPKSSDKPKPGKGR